MKPTLFAIIATCAAMLATSGIVVLATASTAVPAALASTMEEEMTAELDVAIARQLVDVKNRLALPR